MAKQISIKHFEESEFSRKPEQATEESAGYDLYAADTITILPKTCPNYSSRFKICYSSWIFWINISSI